MLHKFLASFLISKESRVLDLSAMFLELIPDQVDLTRGKGGESSDDEEETGEKSRKTALESGFTKKESNLVFFFKHGHHLSLQLPSELSSMV